MSQCSTGPVYLCANSKWKSPPLQKRGSSRLARLFFQIACITFAFLGTGSVAQAQIVWPGPPSGETEGGDIGSTVKKIITELTVDSLTTPEAIVVGGSLITTDSQGRPVATNAVPSGVKMQVGGGNIASPGYCNETGTQCFTADSVTAAIGATLGVLKAPSYTDNTHLTTTVTTPEGGDIVYRDDTDQLFFYDGSAWTALATDNTSQAALNIPLYADASARNIALPSPTKGQVVFMDDTDTLFYYDEDGTAWKPIDTTLDESAVDAFVSNNNYLTTAGVNTLAQATLSCTSGQVASFNGTDWICGAAGGSVTVDDVTLQDVGGTLSVKNLGIDTAQLAEGAVTTTEIENGTIVLGDLDSTIVESTTIDSTTDGDDLVTEASVEAYVAANAGGVTAGAGLTNTSGTLSVNVDDTTVEIDGSDNLKVKAITTTEITDGTIALADLDGTIVESTTIDSTTDGDDLVTEASVEAYVAANGGGATAGAGLTDTSGTWAVNVDDTTVEIDGSDNLKVKAITTTEITDGTIALGDLSTAIVEATTIDSTTNGDDLVTEAAVEAYVAANAGGVTAGAGLTNTSGTLSVNVDDTTVEIDGSDNLKVKAITTTEITDGTIALADLDSTIIEAATIDSTTNGDDLVTEAAVETYVAANAGGSPASAGSGLSHSGGAYSVNVDDVTIEVDGSDNLKVKAITTTEITDGTIALGDLATTLVESSTLDSTTNGDDLVTEAAVEAYFSANGGGKFVDGNPDANDAVYTAGDVGIGVTNPATTLHVSGTGGIATLQKTSANGVGSATGLTIQSDAKTATDGLGISFVLQDSSSSDQEYAQIMTTINDATDGAENSSLELKTTSAGATATHFIIRGDKVGIGDTDPDEKLVVDGNVRITGNAYALNFQTASDLRLKTNIAPLQESLEKLTSLQGVRYHWKEGGPSRDPQIGLIAQDVQAVFPEVVVTNPDGYMTLNYASLVAPLIDSVKALKAENEILRQRVEALENQSGS